MATEDLAKLKAMLMPGAAAVLAPLDFDLHVVEDGISLELDGKKFPIASPDEIKSGEFRGLFAGRLRAAAGIDDSPETPVEAPIPVEIEVCECNPPAMKLTRRAMSILEEMKTRE